MVRAHRWTALVFSTLTVLMSASACCGSDDSTSGTGGAGAGGSSSSGGSCTPEQTQECYNGPENTQGQGICKPGTRKCGPSGIWEACVGEVWPSTEIYGNQIDEDCNGADAPAAAGLVSDDLVVRHFIDEASSGNTPMELQDAAPETPLTLSLLITSGDNVSFTELDGHRGLSWPLPSLGTKAQAAVAGTKIEAGLKGQKATLEAVVAILDANVFGSPIIYLGPGGDYGQLDLRFTPPQTISFYWKDVEAGRWNAVMHQRSVLHLVVDTAQEDAKDRIRLYRNGQPAPVDDTVQVTVPAKDENIDLGTNAQYVLGNRGNGGRSFKGTLYYGSLYAAALTPDDVAKNAGLLLLDDDNLAP